MHLRSNGVKLQVSNSKYQVRKTGFANRIVNGELAAQEGFV